MNDYYYILGIERNATLEQIKEAYRKLCKKFHPDVNNNDPHFAKMFRDIQEAYECLSDAQKRRQYDNTYSNWNNNQQSRKDYEPEQPPIISIEKDKESTMTAFTILAVLGFALVQLIIKLDNRQEENWFLWGLLGAVVVPAFLAPFLVSIYNRHPMKWAVFAATLILGWTGLGWIGCLVFSLYNIKK